jgi:hypothetical protein
MPRTSRERKTFSLRQANNTLPLVTRIVKDIVDLRSRMRSLHQQAERMLREGRKSRAEELQDQLGDLLQECDEYIGELEHIGCDFKDPDLGLVDFPARLDDRVVYLCWKLGENEISHWHELDAGFSGRRPAKGLF